MQLLAIALVLGVLGYEFLSKKTVTGQSAARVTTATRAPATTAASTTSALSSMEATLLKALTSGGSGSGRASGGSGSGANPFGSSASTAGRPSQSGFSQPSNQGLDPTGRSIETSTGTTTFNTDGTITVNGLLYDGQTGELLTAGPELPGQVQQSAPGDGTGIDNIFDANFLNDFTGGTPTGNQDAILAAEAAASSPDDSGFSQDFQDTF